VVEEEMKIERFEDVKAWQVARDLTKLVYEVTSSGAFARDFRLKDQIRDAAGSVMHNIAEGFDAGSDAEFIRFLRYSRRSASEVQSQLYIALDQTYINTDQFRLIYDKATEVKKLVNGFIGYLRRSNS
jgi:four helix bundle protein